MMHLGRHHPRASAGPWWQASARQQMALSAYWFAVNLQTASLLAIVVPLALSRLAGPEHTQVLARLSGAAAAVGMVATPLIGHASDRLRRWGHPRMPVILLGSAVNLLGLWVMARAQSTEDLGLGLLVAVLGQNGAVAAYEALLPDLVPPDHWGSASGYMGASTLLGTIAGLGIAGVGGMGPAYQAMILTTGAGAALTALTVREHPAAAWEPQPPAPAVEGGHRRFAVAFAARFLIMFGLTLLMTFILYYFQDVLHVRQPGQSTAWVAAMALAGASASSLVMGHLSDRLDRPRVVAVAGLPMAAAAVGFALVPHLSDLLAFAVLYGLGYGAFLSVDWALGVDTVPELASAGRDLGVWGLASAIPGVLAPVAGGWLLARYTVASQGYTMLFLASGGFFFAGSLTVLTLAGRRSRPSPAQVAFRVALALGIALYARWRYPVTVWGSPPRRRGATLVLAGHQHDLDGLILPALLYLAGPWSRPVWSVGSRRLTEPGFLYDRLGFGGALLRRLSLAPLLPWLGVLPLENQPRRRPLASLAWQLMVAHGDLSLEAVLEPRLVEELSRQAGVAVGPLRVSTVQFSRLRSSLGMTPISLSRLRPPYREELQQELRQSVEAQFRRIARTLRGGGSLYLTPEGGMSADGSLGRFKALLGELLPHAEELYGAAVAYDPFTPGRLRMKLHWLALTPDGDLRSQVAAARPITLSQVLGAWLEAHPGPFHLEEAQAGVAARLAELPQGALVDPSLAQDPAGRVAAAVEDLERLGLLARQGNTYRTLPGRRHPRWPAPDPFAYHGRMLAETLAALSRQARAEREAVPPAQVLSRG